MGKPCKECRSDNLPGAPHCEACGYKFPPPGAVRKNLNARNRLKGHAIAITVGLSIAVVREVIRRLA